VTPPVRGRQREPRATARNRAQPRAAESTHTHILYLQRAVHLVWLQPFQPHVATTHYFTLRVAPYRSRRPRARAPPPVSRKYMYQRAGGVPVYVVSGTHSQ